MERHSAVAREQREAPNTTDKGLKQLLLGIFSARLVRSFGIYSLASMLGTALPFLLLPVLTRYLPPYDYGIVAMFQVLTGIVATLTGMSVQGAIGRQYFDQDNVDFPVYVASCLAVLAGSVVVISGAVYWFAESIAALTSYPASWMWAVVAFSASQFVISTTLVLWQVQGKAATYGLFNVALIIVNVVLSLAFVIPGQMGWRGRVLGQVVAYVAFAVIGMISMVRGGWVRLGIRRPYIWSALQFGIPLIPHTLGMWAVTMIGRWLVAREIGLAAAGIYVVGAQIGIVVGVLQDAFNRAWVPWFYEELKKDTTAARTRIVKITYAYNVVILGLALTISALAPLLLRILAASEYAGAAVVVPWIAVGYAFNGMYKMVTNYAFYLRKTHYVAIGTVIAGLTNLGLGFVLVRANGMVGAAQATAAAFLVSYLFTAAVAAKIYPMPSLWRHV